MDFTNSKISEMVNKKNNADTYVKWYYQISDKNENKLYYNKAQNLKECLNYSTWDKYTENLILDLKQINRCKDKFCPNCRKFYASKSIHNIEKPNQHLKNLGYKSYMVTITVPNIEIELNEPSVAALKLNSYIRQMNETFQRFNRKLSKQDNLKLKKEFTIYAGVKSLEITWKIIDKKKKLYSFHPHFHCIVYSNDLPKHKLKKTIQGPYQKKNNKYIKFSELDFYIMKYWTLSWNKQKITKNTLSKLNDIWYNIDTLQPNYYMCDIREIKTSNNGEYEDFIEVFKYHFKDLAIDNIYLFETLVIGTKKLRFTQTFGALHNIDIEYDDTGTIQELLLEIEEDPELLNIQDLNTLTIEYANFTKISRFNAHKNLNKLLDD